MPEIWKIISVIVTSSVKFLLALPLAKAGNLNFMETFLSTSIGGIIGVLFFFFFFNRLLTIYVKQKHKYDLTHKKKPEKKSKKIFTKRNRFIIKIIQQYGLPGVAFITPCIISIPIGCFVAARINQKFIKNTKKTILYLIYSVVGWSILLSSFFHFIPLLF